MRIPTCLFLICNVIAVVPNQVANIDAELDLHIREAIEDLDKPGPIVEKGPSRLFETLPSGEIFVLEKPRHMTRCSVLWTVENRPDLFIKYQVYPREVDPIYLHPLSREFYFSGLVEPLNISPKMHYLSGPAFAPVRAVASPKFGQAGMSNWNTQALGREVRFVVMERIDGKSLLELQNRPFSEKHTAIIGIHMISIIRKLHDATNIVHGDIHAGNWMYQKSMGLKLIDFGRARFVSPQTAHGLPFGKHQLWSPWEQQGAYSQRRDDVYRAVFILVQCLVGPEFVKKWLDSFDESQMIAQKLFANLFEINSSISLSNFQQWRSVLLLARSCTQDQRPPYEAILGQLRAVRDENSIQDTI